MLCPMLIGEEVAVPKLNGFSGAVEWLYWRYPESATHVDIGGVDGGLFFMPHDDVGQFVKYDAAAAPGLKCCDGGYAAGAAYG